MFTSINNIFQMKGNLYITDFLDIFIIGLLIYSIFIFLRRTKTYLVFLGIAITVLLYFVAQSFNLYVTLLTLKYFVGVSLLIFVIIFQTEIRKYFEFIGLIGSRQIKVGHLVPKSTGMAEIIQACVRMAQAKTGALIVIKGKDTLDNFIDGGTDLDGIISEELLLSIFDDHSDGHDGAVIINNNRISKFATHLPLSTNFKEIGKHGTRHSAALGLAEVTDALCITVSEEKGVISICRDGKMKTLAEYSDLEKELDKYIKAQYTDKPEGFMDHFVKHNFILKVGAFLTAFVVWYFAAYQTGIVYKTYNIPIMLDKLPENIVVENYTPKEIKINVSGRGESVFKDITTDNFVVNMELSNLENGANKKTLLTKNIEVPANLSLVSFEPTTVLMTVQKYFQVEIPVTPKTKGTPPKDIEIKSVVVNPDSIKIWVPQGGESPKEIFTEIIDVATQTESVIVPVKLLIPDKVRLLDEATVVNVALTIEKRP